MLIKLHLNKYFRIWPAEGIAKQKHTQRNTRFQPYNAHSHKNFWKYWDVRVLAYAVSIVLMMTALASYFSSVYFNYVSDLG